MSDRITEAMLDTQVLSLNRRLRRPEEPYTKDGDAYHANPGNIHLDHAYGGVQVEEMTDGGGVRNLTDGFDTKRATYDKLRAMHAILDSIVRSGAVIWEWTE